MIQYYIYFPVSIPDRIAGAGIQPQPTADLTFSQ